ncbi:MAG: MFS transporter [Promethearchaeota archaeon]
MTSTTKDSSLLSLSLFVVIVSLISSTQSLISPNLERMSYYFGFQGQTAQLGLLTFTFTLVAAISLAIFGYLADKVVRKWILVSGTLLYSIFSMFIMLISPDFVGYILFFFLASGVGVGYGAIIPSIFSLIGDLVKQQDRSKGYSFFSIASLLGMIIGLLIATIMGPIDWRLSYFIIGLAGLFNAVLILLFFKEPSRIGKDFSYLLDKEVIDYTYRIRISDLKMIFKKKCNFWLVVNFVDTIPTGIITFLLFYYMSEYHNVPEGISLIILFFVILSSLIGTVIFGFIGDNLFKKGKKRARVLLALMGNLVPIPFVFIALIIPFELQDNASFGDLFLIPGAVIMILFFMIGLFVNGAVNGSWYATVVDINLPEHRGTVLATSNFFDIIGRAIGPLIGSLVADAFGLVYGMMISIFFWILIPLFWISVLKNVIPEMEETERIFKERLRELSKEEIL